MLSSSEPWVSIVTPVYNNEDHIAECIRSIQAQTYTNWDYTIVDNCSIDGSVEIASRFAATDSRIRVVRNSQFLRAVANHNRALREISPKSLYCKIVFADDWIFPRCIEEMVSLAERYPSLGVVGAYGLQGEEVMWAGLPYGNGLFSGRDVCRRLFLNQTYVFGTSTSVLYRSELVRNRNSFYNESNLHADIEACLMLLKESDFGFVHQILTFKRVREASLGSFTEDIKTLIAGHLYCLVTHGRDFLSEEEYVNVLRRRVANYYNFLAVSFLRGRRDRAFWDYHKRKLNEAGVSFSTIRFGAAMIARLIRAVVNPLETFDKLLHSPL
ncbi:MAG TPA: glycosyltransferase family 2 protein [Bryobacteraceae bacterium]|nr:glycosyltransferase family 2 protein [Bryobacteraceae bacterium]